MINIMRNKDNSVTITLDHGLAALLACDAHDVVQEFNESVEDICLPFYELALDYLKFLEEEERGT